MDTLQNELEHKLKVEDKKALLKFAHIAIIVIRSTPQNCQQNMVPIKFSQEILNNILEKQGKIILEAVLIKQEDRSYKKFFSEMIMCLSFFGIKTNINNPSIKEIEMEEMDNGKAAGNKEESIDAWKKDLTLIYPILKPTDWNEDLNKTKHIQ
ncbi:hypothetical protein C1646_759973 [Rhizophagus diaphanus]|nr:hypothetical protein C1646_759973 [Rhizophagus diaphanus] [Rhizophagus sp. MUCL 43196]